MTQIYFNESPKAEKLHVFQIEKEEDQDIEKVRFFKRDPRCEICGSLIETELCRRTFYTN